jgi:protein phosphatase
MLRLSGTGATHTGLVRADNQDAGFYGPDLMLVADGVGGSAAGEVASATTAYAHSAAAMSRRDDDPTLVLTDAVRLAQEQLRIGVVADPGREGMATTLTAVLTNGERFAIAHLGDSRGYVLREGELIRVTRDHTYVAHLVDEGQLTEDQALVHPWRNVVTRIVNDDPTHRADVLPLALRPGDRVLLASDGLTDLVSEEIIATVLDRHGDDAAGEALVAAALTRGGRDNVTCLLATVVEGPRIAADGNLLGALRDPANIVDAAAVRTVRTA